MRLTLRDALVLLLGALVVWGVLEARAWYAWRTDVTAAVNRLLQAQPQGGS